RLRADVRSRKAELSADLRACLDRSTHLELAPEQPVRRLHFPGCHQPPNLRAVEFSAVDLERRYYLDTVPVRPEPFGVARAATSEREVEPDDPGLDVHHRDQSVDELLGRKLRQLSVEAEDDRVLDAGGINEAKLFAECCDR